MLKLVPMSLARAKEYVTEVHRHNSPPLGYKFAIGVESDGNLVGVAIAGRPVARMLDDGLTLEVTRVATDGTDHVCSMLYGACWRAAKALGYLQVVTYTRADEPGTSLRAAGWVKVAEMGPRTGWDTPSRRRSPNGTEGVGRVRWRIGVTHA
jgi:hypothetical protein